MTQCGALAYSCNPEGTVVLGSLVVMLGLAPTVWRRIKGGRRNGDY